MKTTYHALIAGNNAGFRNHLKGILKMAEKENNHISLVAFEALTMDDLEKQLDSHADVAFIDSAFVLRESKRLARAWKKTKSECAFALLLSDHNAAEMKNIIQEMGRQNALPSEIHVLKSNYPDELIMRVILRIVELGVDQKNMAVV